MKTIELLELLDRYDFLMDESNNLLLFELPEDEKAALVKEMLFLSGKENVIFETSDEGYGFTGALITSPNKELKLTLIIHKLNKSSVRTEDQFARAVSYCLLDFNLETLKEKYKLGRYGL